MAVTGAMDKTSDQCHATALEAEIGPDITGVQSAMVNLSVRTTNPAGPQVHYVTTTRRKRSGG